MHSKFRTKKGKPNVRVHGFSLFHDFLDPLAEVGKKTMLAAGKRFKQEKLAAKKDMVQAANGKRARRATRNLKLLDSSPNYGRHRHAANQ